MASQQTKAHDPMYNFDTHFPERLSRLHLHGDLSGSFRKKKNKAQRSGARYKTQPVTFDEITEVDEEPTTSPGVDKDTKSEQLKGQLQAFSRSMDGLLPKGANVDQSQPLQHHISHSRSGSRKYQRHPDCIPERVDLEQQQSPTPQSELNQNRLQSQIKFPVIDVKSTAQDISTPPSLWTPPEHSGAETNANLASTPPVPSPNVGPRRQKVTAKAKKRQKATEDGDIS